MLDLVTRLAVAVGYAALTVVLVRLLPATLPDRRPARIALAATTALWSAWYLALALLDPPAYPWGVLNRALHLPLIVSVWLNVWAANRPTGVPHDR